MRAVQCLAGSVGVTARDAPSGPSHILSFHLPAPATYNRAAHEPRAPVSCLCGWIPRVGVSCCASCRPQFSAGRRISGYRPSWGKYYRVTGQNTNRLEGPGSWVPKVIRHWESSAEEDVLS